MHTRAVTTRLLCLAPLATSLALLASCGDTPVVEQATTRPPLQAGHLAVTQTGDAAVIVPPDGVSLRLDDAGLLVVEVRARSTAATPQSIALRATLDDGSGRIVGDATGGAVRIAPGSEITVELSGPTPLGTIAAVIIEVHTVPAPIATPAAAP
jgi:hypothetical protein